MLGHYNDTASCLSFAAMYGMLSFSSVLFICMFRYNVCLSVWDCMTLSSPDTLYWACFAMSVLIFFHLSMHSASGINPMLLWHSALTH